MAQKAKTNVSGARNPFFGKIQGCVARAVDLQRRVSDQQRGIASGEHRVEIGSHRRVVAGSAQPFGEQDLGQRH